MQNQAVKDDGRLLFQAPEFQEPCSMLLFYTVVKSMRKGNFCEILAG